MLKEKLLGSLLLFALVFTAQSAEAAASWLHTEGNRIRTESGQIWMGVGANMHDTRSCNACTWGGAPNPDEVKRRIDMLVDEWGANFIRLDLESYGSSSVLSDAAYLQDVVEIVDHIGTKPGVYVLLSLWIDPSFTDMGWPTAATRDVWRKLAQTFRNHSHVMYGLVNEPQHNYDGAQNATVWNAMNDAVTAIRDVEDSYQTPRHIIAVQGVGGWSRFLGYYVNNPIEAGGGENIAYEVHVYDPQSTFAERFVNPSMTLPVIIGEYGPMHGMSMNDCSVLQQRAFELKVPTLAWTFHMRCPPNLIVDNSNGGCGVGMDLQPTSWGQLLKDHLASVQPYLNSLDTDGSGPVDPAPVDPTPVDPDPVDPVDPVDPGAQYDPSFTLGANNNEWWVEVFADADSVELELSGGRRAPMPATGWGSFAANTNVPRGTQVRLHFRLGAAAATTEWFSYLVVNAPGLEQPLEPNEPGPVDPVEPDPVEPDPVDPVEPDPVEPDPVDPVEPDPVDPVEPAPVDPSWTPELSVGPNVNEWWIEVYANADSVKLYLADGRALVLAPTGWGTFAVSAFVARNTSVRFEATRAGSTRMTTWFPWLNGQPSFTLTPPARSYDPAASFSSRSSEWWPNLTADADTVLGQLESNGEIFTFSKRRSSFVSNLRPIGKGTRIRLFFSKGSQKAQTRYFRYLVDEMTME